MWRAFRRPSSVIALGTLLTAGFFCGVLFWGGFHWAIELSNTETFCLSCHEMRDNPHKEMQGTIHVSNRTGIEVICSDCHVPKEWVHKIPTKIWATKDLLHHIAGSIPDAEAFEAQRLDHALTVWRKMKATDSRECRSCHSAVWKDMSKQWGGAQRNHELATENGNLTCIDCHQGIAHQLPKGFERPTPEQLVQDPSAWLREMEKLAADAGGS